jgi:hypothetical protein
MAVVNTGLAWDVLREAFQIYVVNTAFDFPGFMSFGIQMWYSQTSFMKIIMQDGNRPVNNSISFWKLLRS